MIPSHRESVFWWAFFLFWFVFFFRGWYALSYTKLRELSAGLGATRSEQLIILHPSGEMESLLALRHYIETKYPQHRPVFMVPRRQEQLPQSTDLSILRAIMYPWHVQPVDAKQTGTDNLEVFILRAKSPDQTEPEFCHRTDTAHTCPCGEEQKIPKDRLCWRVSLD